MALSTHRAIQLSTLMETASANRVRDYICAINASSINNRTAARYFTKRAARWEAIRIRCCTRLFV